MNPFLIIAFITVGYFCLFASVFTAWLIKGRPVWIGLILVVWLLISFFYAAGSNPDVGSYVNIRLAIISVLIVLMGLAVAKVRRLEIAISDARRRGRELA